jgi:hypothetical protein
MKHGFGIGMELPHRETSEKTIGAAFEVYKVLVLSFTSVFKQCSIHGNKNNLK